jgi:hypothetical protein
MISHSFYVPVNLITYTITTRYFNTFVVIKNEGRKFLKYNQETRGDRAF